YNFIPEEGALFGAGIALSHNQGVTNWQVSPGGVVLEELCCRAMCRLFDFAPGADATFMYCGTYANQEALYLAIHRKAERCGFDYTRKGLNGFKDPDRLAVVASEDAHFSLKHALRIMGLGEQSLVTVPVDENRRIDIPRMAETLDGIRGKKDVFCVVITAGSTSTGTVDPVFPIIKLCEKMDVWIHVDGAYGLAFRLVPELRQFFSGIELADSVSWDPHKQFGVPIPNSILFVSRADDFNRAALFSDYFNRKEDTEPNPGFKSPPSTRPLSALPLVTSLLYQGINEIIKKLRAPIEAVKFLAESLRNEPDIEMLHEPQLGVLCIRLTPAGFPEDRLNDLQQFIYSTIMKEGKRSISMTKIDDKTVLRFVAVSPSVTAGAMMETVHYIREVARKFPV
ncbi:pyridoxal phosphate-dependent decarboxylase family protein, partial [candidate division KSB1 bacterium]